MTIYVPRVYFELDEADRDVADVLLHGFFRKEDAELVYPALEITTIEINLDRISATVYGE